MRPHAVATNIASSSRSRAFRGTLLQVVFHRSSLRLVAVLLTALACAEVSLDAACDPISLPNVRTTIAANQAGSGDACAASCVPDCFCCSRSETAGPALALPSPTLLDQAAAVSSVSIATGIRPVLEPPPIARS
jgi:hypothetical protein